MPKIVDHEARRAHILDAARDVFGTHGLASTNLTAVAARAGFSKSTLYHYFDTRDALVDALIAALLAREVSFCDAILGGEGTVDQRLGTCLGGTLALVDQWVEIGPLLVDCLRRPSGRAAVAHTTGRVRAALASVLREGQRAGSVRAGDPDAMAAAVVASLQGMLLMEIVEPGSAKEDRFRAELNAMLARAIGR